MFINYLYNLLILPVLFILSELYKILNKDYKERNKQASNHLKNLEIRTNNKIVWIHASSMGEFEQSKFIIQKLKDLSKEIYIVVSFFSPSAYENQKNYNLADKIIYLPFDSKKNATKLVETINPDVFILVRYDFWLNILSQLRLNKSRMILINATKPNFNFFIAFYKNIAGLFHSIYCANQEAYQYYNQLEVETNILKTTDTRYDRINDVVQNATDLSQFKNFKTEKMILVCGSTWGKDEELLSKIKLQDILLIIVPHKPNKQNIQKSKELFKNSILLSQIESADDSKTIIVDSIGILLSLYKLADIAFVGGGLGAGLHSVSEPAGYGLPIIVTGGVEKSIDASALKESDALFIADTENQLNSIIEKLKSEDYRINVGNKSKRYIQDNLGTSNLVLEEIKYQLSS